MKIIVLEGDRNTGKSTTINLAHVLVLNAGGQSTNKQKLGGDPKDFSDIVIGYKNLKIAFFSMGDNSTELARAIRNYNSQNCDILICALSTNPPKQRAKNELKKYKCIRLLKTIDENLNTQATTNNSDARAIFILI